MNGSNCRFIFQQLRFLFSVFSVLTSQKLSTSSEAAETYFINFICCVLLDQATQIYMNFIIFLLFYSYCKAVKAKTTRQFPSPHDKENIYNLMAKSEPATSLYN